jgi:hypothetical protein
VFPVLPVPLACPFLKAPSVISNVYLSCVLCVRCCQCLWLVHSWWPLQLSLTCICPVSCVWMDKPETLTTPDTQDTGQINVRDNWSGHPEWTSQRHWQHRTHKTVISNVYLSCVLCIRCCQCLWLVHSWWPLQLSLTFICPVSCVSGVASVSGLSIHDKR